MRAPEIPGEYWIHRRLEKEGAVKARTTRVWTVQHRQLSGRLVHIDVARVEFNGPHETVFVKTKDQPHGYIKGHGTVTIAGQAEDVAVCLSADQRQLEALR